MSIQSYIHNRKVNRLANKFRDEITRRHEEKHYVYLTRSSTVGVGLQIFAGRASPRNLAIRLAALRKAFKDDQEILDRRTEEKLLLRRARAALNIIEGCRKLAKAHAAA